MTQPDTADHKAGGNTKTPALRSRTWVFTINNHNDTDIREFMTLATSAVAYRVQEERGEQKTEHLQGVIKFKNARTFDRMKKNLPRAHLEKCKHWKESVEYCSKPTFDTARSWQHGIPKKVIDPMQGLRPRDWQIKLLNILRQRPHPRKIHWMWESKGNTGKTTIAKHICMTQNAIYVRGKAADIKYAVAAHLAEKGELDILIIDLPRTMDGYVSYTAIEEVKNGIFFTTKYESGMTLFNPPHLVVFANSPPDINKLSEDRWDITTI